MEPYKPFKYATEAGVNLYLGPYRLCQQRDFEMLKDDEVLPHYNIYLICQRNRIGVRPDSIRIEKESIFFYFDVHDKGDVFQVPASMKNPFASEKLTLESEFPHDYFYLVNADNEAGLVKSSHLLDEARDFIIPRPSFLDLEVLYVGQTQRTAENPIVERLINHQTLQEIYSKITPDKEIHLLLCCFIADGAIEIRGSVRTQEEYEKEDTERLKTFMKNRLEITPEQQVTLAEAALIRYFEPKYNKEYKDTFPTKRHSSYDECYKLDLNAISIEIDGFYYLYSDKVASSIRHSETFNLNTDEERRTLFDFSVGFDT